MSISYHSRSPEEEIHLLKLELQARTSELHKLQAVSDQKHSFLTQQLEEVKAREANIKSMNDTIMQVLQEITNSNTKISTELQLKQFLEIHLANLHKDKGENSRNSNENTTLMKNELEKISTRNEELLKEKDGFLMRISCLEEEKIKLIAEIQSSKGVNRGIYDKIRYDHEKELEEIRVQLEDLHRRKGDYCSMDLMKSQIKEMATQHLIENNSLKNQLIESRAKFERITDTFSQLREKNSRMKRVIQGLRAKEARLKEVLFERTPIDCFEEEEEFTEENNEEIKPRFHQKKMLEFSSITNIFDAFSSQDFVRISPQNHEFFGYETERTERIEALKSCGEIVKKRSLSQQLELKPEEFSKPFELERDLQSTKDNGDSNKKEPMNDSMEEYRVKGEPKPMKGVSMMKNQSDFAGSRTKKTMKSLI